MHTGTTSVHGHKSTETMQPTTIDKATTMQPTTTTQASTMQPTTKTKATTIKLMTAKSAIQSSITLSSVTIVRKGKSCV